MQTQFRGKPLGDGQEIGFLEGDFGREFLKEYSERVKVGYRDNKFLEVLSESDGLVKGSNPFAVVLANQVLRGTNLRTATQADLEKALRLNVLDLRGTYEDTGLVLRSEADPNGYLARDLLEQLRVRNVDFEFPFLLNLTDLESMVNPNSNYRLVFDLRRGVIPIYAPILSKPSSSRFSSKDIEESTGLPKQVGEEGDRHFYTRDSGLCVLHLGVSNLDLYSYSSDLGSSNSNGRIIVVSGVATQKISE